MGIHGLATFLRENRKILAESAQRLRGHPTERLPIVVDGWSLIYSLYIKSSLPWVYGGEYSGFASLLRFLVDAWTDVGFDVYFVFDGAYSPLKFATEIDRLTKAIVQPSLLFYRTSQSSRSTARFMNETRIIPPLMFAACVNALQSIKTVQVFFADEEADPFAVQLAGKLKGYVVGNDSDFVVLNAEGYKGYIPLDDMVWSVTEPESLGREQEDDGFTTVQKRKTTVHDPIARRGFIPPAAPAIISGVSFTIYSPSKLSAHLKLPVSLLPLLGAIVGNDFSRRAGQGRLNPQFIFFDRRLTLPQRIYRVAETIQTVIGPTSGSQRKPGQQKVTDLIEKTVNTLLSTSPTTNSLGSGELSSIIENIIQATLQYAIPPTPAITSSLVNTLADNRECIVHGADECVLVNFFSHNLDEGRSHPSSQGSEIQEAYVLAYREGRFSPLLLDILCTCTFWPKLFLESPDLETVTKTIGRPIYQWIYAILDEGVGIPELINSDEEDRATASTAGVGEDGEDSDSDELIDVVESDDEQDSDEDLLAPLKGALQELHGSEYHDSDSKAHPSLKAPFNRPRSVNEYGRRGTRIAFETIKVVALSELLTSHGLLPDPPTDTTAIALAASPIENRISTFLGILASDVESVRSLPAQYVIAILSLRWVVHTLHTRACAQEPRSNPTTPPSRHSELRWTKREAACFLASITHKISSPTSSEGPAVVTPTPPEYPVVVDRHVQLTAQVTTAIASISMLADVLLLSEQLPSPVLSFSGKVFHTYLNGTYPLPNGSRSDAEIDNEDLELWQMLQEACEEGLEGEFSEEKKKQKKEKQKEKLQQQQQQTVGNGKAQQGKNNKFVGTAFNVLAMLDSS